MKHWLYDSQLNSNLGSTTVAVGRPDNKQNHCRTGEECECEELRLRRGLTLVAIAMMS